MVRKGVVRRKRLAYYGSDDNEQDRLKRKTKIESVLEKQEKKRKQVSDLIKQSLDDAEHGRKADYSNMNKIVQEWIVEDQKRRLEKNYSEEMIDYTLLRQLPRDLIFDIIDFIPTYSERTFLNKMQNNVEKNSKMSGISVEEILKELPDAGCNPQKLKERRKFDCAMRLDCNLVTFHKMRLICKEYALRMKHNIFSIQHLDMTHFDSDNQLFIMKLLSFIKDQQYYHDQHECDNIFMYFHFQQIKDVMKQQIDIKDLSDDDEPVIEVINNSVTNGNEQTLDKPVDPLADGTSSTSEGVVAPVATSEEELPISYTDDDEDNEINMHSAHMHLIPYHKESIHNHRSLYQFSLPIELSSVREIFSERDLIENFTVSIELLSPIIGVNTVLKSCKVSGDFRDEICPLILASCLNLKTFSFYGTYFNYSEPEKSLVHENLEILEYISPTSEIYEVFESIESLLKLCPNLSSLSISMIVNTTYFIDDVQQAIDEISLEDNTTKRLVFTIDGAHYKDITPTGRARKWPVLNISINSPNTLTADYVSSLVLNHCPVNSEDIISNFIDPEEAISIRKKKEFMDALFIDGNFPIEGKIDSSEHPLVFQYAIYIANEYQNGRLYYESDNIDIEKAIRFGWQVGESWDEVLKFLNVNDMKAVLVYLRKKYNDDTKFFKFIRTLILDMCTVPHKTKSETGLLGVMHYLKNEKFNFSDIFSVVRCIVDTKYLSNFNIQSLHLPFMSYPFFTDMLYVPTQILSLATEDDLLYQNENGDSILTAIYNNCVSYTLIDILLKRAPKLAKISNKQNRNPLHLFAAHECTNIDWFLYCKENFGLDHEQLDIVGKTPIDYMVIQSQMVGRLF